MLPELRFIWRKKSPMLVLWAAAILASVGWSTATVKAGAGDVASPGGGEIPAGFGVERYARLWERNPFALETPPAPQARRTAFDDLFLTSWLNEGGKAVVSVQNSRTGEVQRVTAQPNQNNLRLLGIHMNPNPQLVEAVLTQGPEQGTIKFRFDPAAGTNFTGEPNNGPDGQPFNPAGTKSLPPTNQSNAQPTPIQGANRFYPGMARVRTEGASTGQQGIHVRSKFRRDPPVQGSAAPAQ
jgi:hypothetical protein